MKYQMSRGGEGIRFSNSSSRMNRKNKSIELLLELLVVVVRSRLWLISLVDCQIQTFSCSSCMKSRCY